MPDLRGVVIEQIYAGSVGWVGMVLRDGVEVYRTGGYHLDPYAALTRCLNWLDGGIA